MEENQINTPGREGYPRHMLGTLRTELDIVEYESRRLRQGERKEIALAMDARAKGKVEQIALAHTKAAGVLHRERVCGTRSKARMYHLAYAYLRGRPRSHCEPRIKKHLTFDDVGMLMGLVLAHDPFLRSAKDGSDGLAEAFNHTLDAIWSWLWEGRDRAPILKIQEATDHGV